MSKKKKSETVKAEELYEPLVRATETFTKAKAVLGDGPLILVGLRPEPGHRECIPIEVRVENGVVTEAAPIYFEAEDIDTSLARAAGRMHEIYEKASVEAWPPKLDEYELFGAARLSLMAPAPIELVEGELPRSSELADALPSIDESVTKALVGRYPQWRKSVAPVRPVSLELREDLQSWRLVALNAEGNELSRLTVMKEGA